MKFFMTEQDKGNLLIQVTAWVGLTVCVWKGQSKLYARLLCETTCKLKYQSNLSKL